MYHIVYGFLYLLSPLPLRILYLLSDFAYFILYYVVGYRKKIVMQNLSIAFPYKSEQERTTTAKKFYRNFTDTFIETIKFISATPGFFDKHFTADFSVLHEAYKSGKPVQIHVGHNFNWELVNLAVPRYLPGPLIGVFLPLNNKLFDRLFRNIRNRFGTKLVAATRMREEMMPYRGTKYFIGLVADQSPPGGENAYWVKFFGKPTAFLKGPEKAARRNDSPVLFAHFTKSKRGYYNGFAELCTDTPGELQEGQITQLYAKYLERVMTANPEMWLWSHRRWKLEWKEEYGPVLGEK